MKCVKNKITTISNNIFYSDQIIVNIEHMHTCFQINLVAFKKINNVLRINVRHILYLSLDTERSKQEIIFASELMLENRRLMSY